MNFHSSIHVQKIAGEHATLRIAVVTETYPPDINGVAHTLSKIVAGLKSNDHVVWLVRPRQGTGDLQISEDKFQEVFVKGLPIPFYKQLRMGLPAKKELTRLWTQHRPDLVHIATEGPLGWSALKVAQKLKLPISTDFRTNFHAYSQHYGIGWLRGAIMAYMKKFHNAAHSTMVPTLALEQELSSLGFERLHVVPRGVDTDLFSPDRRSDALRASWGATQSTQVLICVSRLAPEKNMHLVVKAYQALYAKNTDTKLVIVGDGPMLNTLKNLAPDAIFAGFKTGEELAMHYASGDLFVFASLSETFGNVTLEAMASGLPIVAFRHAAAGEVITSGIHGILVEPGDESQFISSVASLGGVEQQRIFIAKEARSKALSMSWASILKKTEDVFYEVVN
ncbi:MAG: glycosyltransferase family 1 protein [Betaproteobacteria bacterium]|nr:glycosyltransferase family 1 protein [Betaproteobacteria bacterium]